MAVVKLNISLEPEMADLLRARAADTGSTISGYISTLVRDDHRRWQDEVAREGYELLSHDTRAFTDTAIAIADEVWEPWSGASPTSLRSAKEARTRGRKTATR